MIAVVKMSSRWKLTILVTAALGAYKAAEAATAPAWACSSIRQPGVPPTTACADNTCNPQQANMGGDLLVLATGSLDYTHGGFNPIGSNPADCCSLCKESDNCNAWNFCNNKAGCGGKGSCTNYTASLNASATALGRTLLPLVGFGAFGGCTSNGTWPYQVCSLKRVANTSSPPVYEKGAQAKGWVSGVVPKLVIAGCPAGLTAKTCAECKTSKAPWKCHACAKQVQIWRTGAASCIACSSLLTAAQQETCISCLKINSTSGNNRQG